MTTQRGLKKKVKTAKICLGELSTNVYQSLRQLPSLSTRHSLSSNYPQVLNAKLTKVASSENIRTPARCRYP